MMSCNTVQRAVMESGQTDWVKTCSIVPEQKHVCIFGMDKLITFNAVFWMDKYILLLLIFSEYDLNSKSK